MNEHMSVSPLDKPVLVTRWAGVLAKKPAAAKSISLYSLMKALRERHAPTKDHPVRGLDLLKLSEFGDTPTDKGYLRNDANLRDMHGVELDYDDETIDLDAGMDVLAKANIGCVVYTSPSHTPEAPRWRILAPFSQPLPQDQRGLLLGRIAGAFHAAGYGNPFSRESWVPATCYYYGYVEGNEAHHRVEAVDGYFIDTLDDLDNGHWQPEPHRKPYKDALGRTIPGRQGAMDWDSVDAVLAETGDGVHGALMALAGKLVGEGWSWDDIYADLMQRLQDGAGKDPRHRRHKRWLAVSADRRKEVSNVITGAFRLEAANHPLMSKASDRDTPGSGSSQDEAEGEQAGDDGASDQPRQDKGAKAHKPLVLTAREFVAGFTPPAYLVNGILQRGYLYSLTARTGHGKTAIALYMAQCIARGEPMHGAEVKRGSVLMLAGENPDDIRARYLVLAEEWGFDPETLRMHFIAGVVDVAKRMTEIRAATDAVDDLMLVIVDTAAAYYPGDETNSNSQQGAYARLLRGLTFLNGKPTVLVCCHPVKNAPRDNLVPMGGSAFINEVDGNLTLWANSEKQTSLHWQAKFRGPEFDPMAFDLAVAASDRVKDAEGRLMPSVVAKPISQMTLEAVEAVQEKDEDRLLRLIYENPNASFTQLADRMGFLAGGKPKVQRIVERLKDDKLIIKRRNQKYVLTPAGKKEINANES